jgi:hypothetical protein
VAGPDRGLCRVHRHERGNRAGEFLALWAGYLHFDWPVGFVALVFFLAGFVPPWAAGRLRRWRLKRRIATLESSLVTQAGTYPPTDAASDAAQPDIHP